MVHLTSSFLTVLVLLQSSCGAPKLWGAGYGLDSAGSSRALLETSLSAIAAGNITYITHGGAESSVILTSTGVLYSWGSNTYGQLGDGSNAAKYTPVLVNTAVTSSTISRVRCGSYTCIALSSANELIGFGHNTYGTIGDCTTANKWTPVLSLKGAIGSNTISNYEMGYGHVVAQIPSGNLYAWGRNDYGQVGDASTVAKSTPVSVSLAKNITKIAVAGTFSFALATDNTLWVWGVLHYMNSASVVVVSVGDGTSTYKSTPVAVSMSVFTSKTILDIKASTSNALVLTTDGYVFSTGYNAYYAVADGTTTDRTAFVACTAITNVATLYGETVTGIVQGPYATYFKTNANRYYVLGYNAIYTAGIQILGGTGDKFSVPVELYIPGKRITSLHAGGVQPNPYVHIITDGCDYTQVSPISMPSLKCNGTNAVYAYGGNPEYQLGDGTTTDRYNPPATQVGASVFAGKTIVSVKAGMNFYVALTSTGVLYSWGSGTNYRLGDGTTTSRGTPAPVNAAGGSGLYGKTVVAMDCGLDGCLAVTTDNILIGWGRNWYGCIGDGTYLSRSVPVVSMKGLMGSRLISQLRMGDFLGLALAEGKVYSWGQNHNGELGEGSAITERYYPMPVLTSGVLAGKTVTQLAAGGHYAMVLTADNKLFAWGVLMNAAGSVLTAGDGGSVARNAPVTIDVTAVTVTYGAKTIAKISVGFCTAQVLTADGWLFAVGDNSYFQIEHPWDSTVVASRSTVVINQLSLQFVMSGTEYQTDIIQGTFSQYMQISSGRWLGWGQTTTGLLGVKPGPVYVPLDIAVPPKTLAMSIATYRGTELTSSTYLSMVFWTDGCEYCGPSQTYVMGSGYSLPTVVPELASEYVVDVKMAWGRVSAAAGRGMHAAITKSGKLYTWGTNYQGLLGDGTTSTDRTTPLDIGSNKFYTKITCHWNNCMGVTAAGDLVGWGAKVKSTVQTTPVNLRSGVLTNQMPIFQIACGIGTFYVLGYDYKLYSYGDNTYGSLGDNGNAVTTATTSFTYVTMNLALSGKYPIQISAGNYLASVVTSDGGLYNWGALYFIDPVSSADVRYGIGDNSNPAAGTRNPTKVAIDVSNKFILSNNVGYTGANCLASDHFSYGYGEGQYGQLGNYATVSSNTYVLFYLSIDQTRYFGENWDAKTIITGERIRYIVTDQDRLMAAGSNADGLLGIGYASVSTPLMKVYESYIPPFKKISKISTSGVKTIFTMDGCDNNPTTALPTYTFSCPGNPPKLHGLGSNSIGQLALPGGTATAYIPTQIDMSGILNGQYIVDVKAGLGFTVALSSTGKLYSWGNNTAGTLGDNSVVSAALAPVAVDVSASSALYQRTVNSFACGATACFAVTNKNDLVYWGNICTVVNGVDIAPNAVTRIPTLIQRGAIASRPILSIVMGTHHAMALTRNHYYNAGTDTAIFSWGFNQAGQLGDGTNTNRMYPDSIVLTSFNGKTMSMMAAGGYISMVLNTDSSIYAWGTLSSIANSTVLGMGDGAGVARNVPTVISSSLYGNKIIKSISASYSNAMALASDGSIYAFGDNSYLQVGDASANTTAKLSMIFSVVPSTYTNVTGEYYTSIFQGVGLSVARTNYGRFFMWGDTNVNVCGSSVGSLCSLDGLYKNMSSPFIALPNSHARYNESFLLVATDGCEYTIPLVSRNYTTNCGNASFYSWGSNSYGQIGDRSTLDRLSPVAPFTSTDFGRERIVEVKYGSYHGVALTVSGKLYSWGLNTGGSLGNTNTTTYTQLTPTIISGIPRTVVSVTCGTASCIALLSDNSMYGWGNNTFGELGDGTTTSRPLPVFIYRGKIKARVISSIQMGSYHTLVYTTDGNLFSWGSNSLGQLGIGSASVDPFTTPEKVNLSNLGGASFNDTSTGGNHGMIYTGVSTNTLYVWGAIYHGSSTSPSVTGPGDNTATPNNLPVTMSPSLATLIGPGRAIVSMKSGLYNAIFVLSDGVVFLVGDQTFGQCSSATLVRKFFGPCTTLYSYALYNGETITAVDQATRLIIYTTSKGRVLTIGDNSGNGLGVGANSTYMPSASLLMQATLPLQVVGTVSSPQSQAMQTITAVSNNCPHNTVNIAPPTFACSKSNNVYQYGPGGLKLLNTSFVDGFIADVRSGMILSSTGKAYTLNGTLIPTTLLTSSAILFMACNTPTASDSITCVALAQDNTLMGWGSNQFGQLGDGTTTDRATPVLVSKMAIGSRALKSMSISYHTLFLTQDSKVYATGNNQYGQIGDSTNINRILPVFLQSIAPVTIVKTVNGPYHSIALTSSGTSVYMWGAAYSVSNNGYYLTGDGTTVAKLVPTPVSVSERKFVDAASTHDIISLVATSGEVFVILDNNGTVPYFTYTPFSAFVYTSPTLFTVFTYVLQSGERITNVEGMYNAHYFYTSYGRVLAFGVNTNGQLNLGANETAAATIPVVMDIPGRNISSIASKVNNLFATDGCEYGTNITVTPSNCAVDNYIYGLGSNTYSQVAGDGSTTNQYIPLLANIQRNIVTIAAGTGFAVVLTTTGNMYAWGLNQNGQLGDGSNINRATPVAVNTNGLTSRIVDVKCGSTSCYALSSDNGFYSWGGNTNIISKVPVGSMGTAVIKSFKVGISHVLVLTTNDRVFTMGDNTLYSLGDGSTTSSSYFIPIMTSTIANRITTHIGAGGYASVAFAASDSSIHMWGTLQQSSVGIVIQRTIPTFITNLKFGVDVITISVNQPNIMILYADGTLYGLGDNTDLLIRPQGSSSISLIRITNLDGVLDANETITSVKLAAKTAYARTSYGRVLAWGSNDVGQVGSPNSVLSEPLAKNISVNGNTFFNIFAVSQDSYNVYVGIGGCNETLTYSTASPSTCCIKYNPTEPRSTANITSNENCCSMPTLAQTVIWVYANQPIIETTSTINVKPGDVISLHGATFTSNATCRFGYGTSYSYVYVGFTSGTDANCTVPVTGFTTAQQPIVAMNLSVSNDGMNYNSAPSLLMYTYLPPPAIVAQDKTIVTPYDTLVLYGTNFAVNTSCKLVLAGTLQSTAATLTFYNSTVVSLTIPITNYTSTANSTATVTVTLSNDQVTFVSTNVTYSYMPPPTVTLVQNTNIKPGSTVSLRGSGFTSSTTCKYIYASSYVDKVPGTYLNATDLICSVPVMNFTTTTTSIVSLRLYVTNDEIWFSQAPQNVTYTYLPPPAILTVYNPNIAPSDNTSLSGSGFTSNTTCRYTYGRADSISVAAVYINSTTALCPVPMRNFTTLRNTTVSLNLAVSNNGEQYSSAVVVYYTLIPLPIIQSIENTNVRPNDIVILHGDLFTSNTTCKFTAGSMSLTVPATYSNSSYIQCNVPMSNFTTVSNITVSVVLSVSNDMIRYVVAPQLITYTYLPPPIITSVNSTQVVPLTGVLLIGSSFTANTTCLYTDGVTTIDISAVYISSTNVVCFVPLASYTSVDSVTAVVHLSASNDGTTYSSAVHLSYTYVPAPIVTASGHHHVVPGDNITLIGSSFATNMTCTFTHGSSVTVQATRTNSTFTQCQVPLGNWTTSDNSTVIIGLSVTNDKISYTTFLDEITYYFMPAPVVTSIDKTHVVPGDTIALRGTSFSNNMTCTYTLGISATVKATRENSTYATCSVPLANFTSASNSIASVLLSVTNDKITLVTVQSISYEYMPIPVWTSTDNVQVVPGDNVTLHGSSFGTNTTCLFGDGSITVEHLATFISDHVILCQVPNSNVANGSSISLAISNDGITYVPTQNITLVLTSPPTTTVAPTTTDTPTPTPTTTVTPTTTLAPTTSTVPPTTTTTIAPTTTDTPTPTQTTTDTPTPTPTDSTTSAPTLTITPTTTTDTPTPTQTTTDTPTPTVTPTTTTVTPTTTIAPTTTTTPTTSTATPTTTEAPTTSTSTPTTTTAPTTSTDSPTTAPVATTTTAPTTTTVPTTTSTPTTSTTAPTTTHTPTTTTLAPTTSTATPTTTTSPTTTAPTTSTVAPTTTNVPTTSTAMPTTTQAPTTITQTPTPVTITTTQTPTTTSPSPTTTTQAPTTTIPPTTTTTAPTTSTVAPTTSEAPTTETPTGTTPPVIAEINFADNSTFGDNVIEGADTLEVANSTNGVITVASTFSSSSKSRRALSTKGGYDLQDKTSFVSFSIDASTTTGNIVELWMYVRSGKFLQVALSITPGSLATSISVRYSSDTTPQQQTLACSFLKQVQYLLKLRIYQETSWMVRAELLQGSSLVCAASLVPSNVPSNFFSDTFTYVLSQSGTGTPVQRDNSAADENMSIQISKMGVECTKGTCASVAPTNTQKPSTTSGTNVGVIAAVIAVIGGIVVLSVIIVVIAIAVFIKKKSKKINVYLDTQPEVEPDATSPEEEMQQTTVYDAFANQQPVPE